jgi:hypothetical protein
VQPAQVARSPTPAPNTGISATLALKSPDGL